MNEFLDSEYFERDYEEIYFLLLIIVEKIYEEFL